MADTTFPEKLEPFKFHGVGFKFIGGQGIADCPICGKEKHFYADPETGKWDCKACLEKGNIYTFLRHVHQSRLADTTDADWQELSEYRKGIDWEIFRDGEIARDGREWLLPIYNAEGKLVNLDAWGGPGSEIRGTKGLKLHMYGCEVFADTDNELLKNPDTLFAVCEGRWDFLALASILGYVEHPIIVLGVPGAGTFKPEWMELLKGRRVALLFDNDDAGQKGMERAVPKLKKLVKSLLVLKWPGKSDDVKDVNDFIAARLDNPANAVEELLSMLVPADGTGTTVADQSSLQKKERKRVFKNRPSWNQVVGEYRRILHTTPETEDALAVLFATVLSNQIPGDPLWTFLVGASGSGKTLVLLSLSEFEGTYFESKLQPQLISGWQVPEGVPDPSPIAAMQGKTVIVEDFTQNLSMPALVQAELFSELRGAYNGRHSKKFKNGLHRVYPNCKFSMIAGVTSIINNFSQTDMGERFIKVQFLHREKHDEFAHIKAAMTSDKTTFQKKREHLGEVAHEFLDYQIDLMKLPKINAEFNHKIIRLSQTVTYLRNTVKRLFGGDVAYRGEREIGTRIAVQLQKLAVSLAIVFGKKVIDKRIYEIVENVALDTAQGYNLDVTAELIGTYPKPVEIHTLAPRCRMGESNLRRRLEDMVELGIVEKRRVEHKGRGQPPYGYIVSPDLRSIWLKAGIRTNRILARHNGKSPSNLKGAKRGRTSKT